MSWIHLLSMGRSVQGWGSDRSPYRVVDRREVPWLSGMDGTDVVDVPRGAGRVGRVGRRGATPSATGTSGAGNRARPSRRSWGAWWRGDEASAGQVMSVHEVRVVRNDLQFDDLRLVPVETEPVGDRMREWWRSLRVGPLWRAWAQWVGGLGLPPVRLPIARGVKAVSVDKGNPV